MRKYLFFVLVGFLICLLSCSKVKIKNIDSLGKNIICFGDSITAAKNLREEERYPALLEKALGLPVINAGRPADTTRSALLRIEEDVLKKNPFLVIIELGGNDFLQKIPTQQTFKNLEKIILKIQERGAMVVLCEIRAGFILKGYARGFRVLAKKYRTGLVPNLLGGILDNPSLKTDYIHPNSKGHKLIAQKILKIIKPLIQINLRLRKEPLSSRLKPRERAILIAS